MVGSPLAPAVGAGLVLGALLAAAAGRYGLAGVLAVLLIGVGLAVAWGERSRRTLSADVPTDERSP